MRLRVIDFETTGQPPEADVIEYGFVDVIDVCDGGFQVVFADPTESQACVIPQRPIELAALAVHHIRPETRWEISWEGAQQELCGGSPDVFVAHNAAFEREFFDPEGSRWICTYKCALRLWPELERHSNQYLRYALGVDDRWTPEQRESAMPPHRALPDAWTTAWILLECLSRASAEELVAWTAEPPYLTKITFGKHNGKLYSEAPSDYLRWMLREDFGEGEKAAAQRALEERS